MHPPTPCVAPPPEPPPEGLPSFEGSALQAHIDSTLMIVAILGFKLCSLFGDERESRRVRVLPGSTRHF
jgi:hypothetical protein